MQPNRKSPTTSCGLIVALLLMIAAGCHAGASAKMHQPFSIDDLVYSIESAKFESQPPQLRTMRPGPAVRTYLIVAYRLTNNGRTSIEVGLPPFELRTADGRRFRPDLLLSLLRPAERAERAGSLTAMADALNTELHPGLGGTYEVAFALPADASRQRLYLIARRGWLGFGEVAVDLVD